MLWVSTLVGRGVRGSGAPPGSPHACALLPANQRRSRTRRGRLFFRENSDLLQNSFEAVKRKHRKMVPSGRKHTGKSGKTFMEDQVIRACDFEKADKKHLIGSEDVIEADINKALLAKRKRLEMYTKASLKTSNQKIENVWKTQQEQRQKLNQEYSQQFLTLFQQWDIDVQKADEQEEKLTNMFRQQQKVFQQSRIVQNQRLKTIKQLYEQFIKSMEDLEKNHDYLLTGAQNELRKEMAMLQKKIMMETQQQEMANVRKSLQSMLF
ncbi:hypothetical protein EI555_014744 [Monodon monoceros]|uniref:XLR/SYCP3/FAM9 domain-containing protein n=1 Tax=Monodon monoceros TaxID=40151 RepID=A0A4U1EPB3_MONMO|nr:hypothetical protein EI555_014744 [Monodon monoceros]